MRTWSIVVPGEVIGSGYKSEADALEALRQLRVHGKPRVRIADLRVQVVDDQADEYIILKWCGRWLLHESPATYRGRKEAEEEAANLDTKTLVLSVSAVADRFDEQDCSQYSRLW